MLVSTIFVRCGWATLAFVSLLAACKSDQYLAGYKGDASDGGAGGAGNAGAAQSAGGAGGKAGASAGGAPSAVGGQSATAGSPGKGGASGTTCPQVETISDKQSCDATLYGKDTCSDACGASCNCTTNAQGNTIWVCTGAPVNGGMCSSSKVGAVCDYGMSSPTIECACEQKGMGDTWSCTHLASTCPTGEPQDQASCQGFVPGEMCKYSPSTQHPPSWSCTCGSTAASRSWACTAGL